MNNFLINKKNQTLSLLIIACACMVSVGSLQESGLQRLTKENIESPKYIKEEAKEKLKLEFLSKMPSFGLENLIADWTMLRFFQYFGDREARQETGYSLSPLYLETIVDKDPRFVQAYLVISPASSMFAGYPERTIELIDRGLADLSPNIPQAYFVWIYKGIDEILFTGDLEKAQKSYTKAAEWATIAGNEKVAKSASETAKFLASDPDSRDAQIGAWFATWVSTSKEEIKKKAKLQIEKLGGELKVYPDGRVEAIPPKTSKS